MALEEWFNRADIGHFSFGQGVRGAKQAEDGKYCNVTLAQIVKSVLYAVPKGKAHGVSPCLPGMGE